MNGATYVSAGGLRLRVARHGAGRPLLLITGIGANIDMWAPLARLLDDRELIAFDAPGVGLSQRTSLPVRMSTLARITRDLLDVLGLDEVDVLGYSFGGGVAFRLAVQHPAMVRRLAMVSAGYAQDGFYPEMLPMQAQVGAAMAEQMKDTPMYKSYVAVAPQPSDFPRLLDRMGEYMRKPYDWSEDVKKLQMPVMLVYGDSDMYRPEHIVRFYQLLGGGLKDAGWGREHMSRNRLAILPDLTHYDIFLSPELPRTVLPFLNGKSGAKRW
jgi:pimeloyl-ACP methyl ester carboxylesterase